MVFLSSGNQPQAYNVVRITSEGCEMRYEGNKVKDINIAYIGGGSQNWARILMKDLALEEQLSGTMRLYDINYQTACDNVKIGNSLAKYPQLLYPYCQALSRRWSLKYICPNNMEYISQWVTLLDQEVS